MRWIVGILLAFVLLAVPATQASPDGYRETNTRIIKHVFGKYGNQAVSVAKCESGLSVWARNGQYLGLFQMGSSERATYGHSYNNAWIQSRAAHRYFVASGRDWSPWSCKPW